MACVYGGANMEKQARRLAEGCQIVVATPGRLMDHYKHHSIVLAHVTQVVLDEADEMLNMGDINGMVLVVVHQTARRCHHDLAALGKACLLYTSTTRVSNPVCYPHFRASASVGAQ